MGERWVSQSEAAALLGVNQSSISRFIAANADVPVRRNERGHVQTVEFNALSAARGSSLSVQDKAAEREDVAPPVETPSLPIKEALAAPRRKDLRDELLAMDIAVRKGELVSRAAVQGAVESAALKFTQGLERRRREMAINLAGRTESREIELLLKDEDRKLLEALVKNLTAAAAGLELNDLEESAAPA